MKRISASLRILSSDHYESKEDIRANQEELKEKFIKEKYLSFTKLPQTMKRKSKSSSSPPPSRSVSFKNSVLELNPLKLLEHLFAECEAYGKVLVEEGVITAADVTEIS